MTFSILLCPPVVTIQDNSALRERLEGVVLPQIVNYMVKSGSYGKLVMFAKILYFLCAR